MDEYKREQKQKQDALCSMPLPLLFDHSTPRVGSSSSFALLCFKPVLLLLLLLFVPLLQDAYCYTRPSTSSSTARTYYDTMLW